MNTRNSSAPPVIENESDRLKALVALSVLDTPRDPRLDELTKMAAFLCETPMAVISLVDKDRQWFKSTYGTDAHETSRDISFCAHAIAESATLQISDTLADPRFSQNPMVIGGPALRFYAGAPMLTGGGHAVGALCVWDTRPRQLTSWQLEGLEILSRQVMLYIESRSMIKESLRLLAESEKMSTLGKLVGSIMHEINNPLTILAGKTEVILRRVSQGEIAPEKIKSEMQTLKRVCNRIVKIVSSVKTYSRNAENDPFVDVGIKEVLEDTLVLCKDRFANAGIDFQLEIGEDLALHCRPTQISQILLNLLSNAADAIAPLSEKWIRLSAKVESGRVRIEVRDSGPGIPAPVVLRMMEPFYTTKDAKTGTGLGLSISKGIAENHGGRLDYLDGQGHTCFVLELPSPQKLPLTPFEQSKAG